MAWASTQVPAAMDLEGLLKFTTDLQDMWEDRRAARRADRHPYEVCFLARWARPQRGMPHHTVCPLLREARMRHVRRARRRIWARGRLAKLAAAVRQGRIPERDIALKDIEAIRHNDEVVEDEHDMLTHIANASASALGSRGPDAWIDSLGFVLAREGHTLEVSREEVDAVFRRLSRRTLKDAHGFAAKALRLFYDVASATS